jgi:glycosyltransferase involved in cell wall biosynthesis
VGNLSYPSRNALYVGLRMLAGKSVFDENADNVAGYPRHPEDSRPRLLFLCQTLPYPPDGGVHIRSYNVLRLLAREFNVTALCFFRAMEGVSRDAIRESVEGLRHLAQVEAFSIPQEHSTARLIADHARSLLTRRAYTVQAYNSSEFRRRLGEWIGAQQFELVHMDSMDLAGYLPMLTGLPVVCVHHNVESALLRRRAAATRGLAGTYIALQARFTEAEERRWCPLIRLNVTVSEEDCRILKGIAPAARFIIVPNGVDTQTFQPRETPEEGIVFVGGHSWQPNQDAMNYFCSEVLPRLRARGCSVPVTWVGRANNAVKREYAERYRVHLTGYVDDIRAIVHRAACYVAPLRVGGGTRLKILDAWAMGKAVVSTSIGCEGLEARDGQNILIRDTAEGFAQAVQTVLTDSGLRQRLGSEARRTVESTYDWEVIGRPMLEQYRHVVQEVGDSTTRADTRLGRGRRA